MNSRPSLLNLTLLVTLAHLAFGVFLTYQRNPPNTSLTLNPHPLVVHEKTLKIQTKTPTLAKNPKSKAKKSTTTPSPTKKRDFSKAIASLQTLRSLKKTAPPSSQSKETRYKETLSDLIQTHIQLPEQGKAYLDLTLSSEGKLLNVTVKEANPSSHRDFLMETLPTLSFPPYDRLFNGAPSYTFNIIVFSE